MKISLWDYADRLRKAYLEGKDKNNTIAAVRDLIDASKVKNKKELKKEIVQCDLIAEVLEMFNDAFIDNCNTPLDNPQIEKVISDFYERYKDDFAELNQENDE